MSTAPPDLRAIISEVDIVSRQLSTICDRLHEFDRAWSAAAGRAPAAPVTAPVAEPQQRWVPPAPLVPPAPPAPPVRTADSRWIGKVLAAAGVAVTLIGVVLLLALAAQAGLLRPEARVAGGLLLGGGLVGAGLWWRGRPGGQTGAIALVATGIAAGYLDAVAVTSIYHWIPAAAGLVVASVVAAGGLAVARRWDSEPLGLLIVTPLIVLAPVLTDGVNLLLIGFLLALSAAVLPVQIGKDWGWLHGVRVGAPTLPLLLALALGDVVDPRLLAAAAALAAALALAGAVAVLPAAVAPAVPALIGAVGTAPVLAAGPVVGRAVAAVLAAALAAAALALAVGPGWGPLPARRVFGGLSAVATVVAVTVAFDGPVVAPVLLGLGCVVALAGHRDVAARWVAGGVGLLGLGFFLAQAGPDAVATATVVPAATAVSTLAASLLSIGWVLTVGWALRCAHDGADPVSPNARVLAVVGGAVVIHAITAFTVTAGVLAFGPGAGFLAGHVAATLCWVAIAAGLFGYASRLPRREHRTAPIGVGLALTAAAMGKLFLFDLGTLDGMFRVAVFLIAGLLLLAMGAGYARSLARQDQRRDTAPVSR